ncbi:MAG: DUF3488 and transglutaminase-like domain-containing protein [Planctomycetota bacterium]
MYHLRQFRRAFYLLVGLGILGFCLSSSLLGLFVIAGSLLVLNAYLVKNDLHRPIPRLLANLVTIAAGAYAVRRVSQGDVPIEPVGVFLVVLQIVKLYEQRGNRDFGQLIVLSLLTMVAAAMTPGGTSLAFGVLFLIWVVLSLYTCLLFHLKVEADAARRYLEAAGPSTPISSHLDDPRLRRDERRLSSSLRRLTALVAVAGATSAVVVFLAFPRGGGASFLHELPRLSPEESVTGFSGNVDFQDIARIQQNTQVAGHIEVLGDALGPIYLRGNALDFYQADPQAPDAWSWNRTPQLDQSSAPQRLKRNDPTPIARASQTNERVFEYVVDLKPSGSDTLFVLDGTEALWLIEGGVGGMEVRSSADGTVRVAGQHLVRQIEYGGIATQKTPLQGLGVGRSDFENDESPFDRAVEWLMPLRPMLGLTRRVEAMRLATLDYFNGGSAVADLRAASNEERVQWARERHGTLLVELANARRVDDVRSTREERSEDITGPLPPADAIIDLALDPAVTGVDLQGQPLAIARIQRPGVTELDARIAGNLERYFRNEYDYSLDVSSEAQAAVRAGRDPLEWFVVDGRRGHCELFAGTMAVALQSLGIEARVVVGYRTDEFNDRIGRWTIRQSDAHAWVEALTADGWRRFDPTPGGIGDTAGDDGFIASIGNSIRQFGEYLTYTWQQSVIGYDRGAQEGVRDSLLARVDEQVGRRVREAGDSGDGETGTWQAFKNWLSDRGLTAGLSGIVAAVASGLLTLLFIAAGVAVIAFALERWRLHRRARRIGLNDLPPDEARRLAKQLGFYDDMVQLLEGLGYRRSPGLTPREFAATLDHLPPAAFERIGGLTEVFYRVRFGQARVTPMRRSLLRRVVDQLSQKLA